MSKKPTKSSKRPEKKEQKNWPAVVYIWIIGLAFGGYLIMEFGWRDSLAHPFHWLGGIAGGLIGIPFGWLWYRWRGDVF